MLDYKGFVEMKEDQQKKEENEICVLCGRILDIKKDLPICFRKYYIEGAGQLCKECFNSLYKTENS